VTDINDARVVPGRARDPAVLLAAAFAWTRLRGESRELATNVVSAHNELAACDYRISPSYGSGPAFTYDCAQRREWSMRPAG
jgi:hypothetical protein